MHLSIWAVEHFISKITNSLTEAEHKPTLNINDIHILSSPSLSSKNPRISVLKGAPKTR
jgi:hypothetical protein